MKDYILNEKYKKGIRLLVSWRGFMINFGTFTFRKDGSLIYSPSFYNDYAKYPILKIGYWNETTKKDYGEKPVANKKGIHVSLHPDPSILHLRQTDEKGKSQTILRKQLNWFPVKKPFLFLRVISPPLDQCMPTKRSSGFQMRIPDNYTGSMEFLIRIFPRSTIIVPVLKKSIYHTFGYCPDYWVCCDFILSNQRSDPTILWPEGDI